MQLNKILVAIDGSKTADKGLEFAIDLSKKFKSSLTIIHAMNLPYVPQPISGNTLDQNIPSIEEVKTILKVEGYKILLKRKVKAIKKNVQADILLVFGDPATEILKVLEDHDLIVLGSRGQGQLKSLILGSVSNKVALYSKKPVLIINP